MPNPRSLSQITKGLLAAYDLYPKKRLGQNFLIDNNLGIDCSGFITHVLQAHFQEINFVKKLFIVKPKKIFRFIISKMRPIENISVKTYMNEKNTEVVDDLKKLKPADLIIMLKTGPQQKRNHILLVTEANERYIKYVHARAWSGEGQYGHGVCEGKIQITQPDGDILEQKWIELDKTENETFLQAKNAQTLSLRRIKF